MEHPVPTKHTLSLWLPYLWDTLYIPSTRCRCGNLTYGTPCAYPAHIVLVIPLLMRHPIPIKPTLSLWLPYLWNTLYLPSTRLSLWLPYLWDTLYLPSTCCRCGNLTYETPYTYQAHIVLVIPLLFEHPVPTQNTLSLWLPYLWNTLYLPSTRCHCGYLTYGTPCTYPEHIVLLECSTARLVDRLWWYFRLIHVGCYIDTWMWSPFFADSHRIYMRSVNLVLHRRSLQYKCLKLNCGYIYTKPSMINRIWGFKTTINSSEWSCLISFSWDPLSCSEQAGIETYKMKIYVSSGIRTHAMSRHEQWNSVLDR